VCHDLDVVVRPSDRISFIRDTKCATDLIRADQWFTSNSIEVLSACHEKYPTIVYYAQDVSAILL
jgi:putative lipase involved disintegration of autophagic bodies